MTELLKSFREGMVFGDIIPFKGNLGIGFFRSEKVTLVDDKILPLRGPPIAVYHPSEYDTASYRCDTGSQTMKQGVVGIYNITQDLWVTSDINYVKPSRTTIILTGSNTFVDDELMIYYYADSPGIGSGMSNLQGDQVTPESIDILIKALNDAHPMIFTEYGSAGDDSPEFRWNADAGFRTGVTASIGSFTKLLDTSDATGTFRWSDFPVYMSELVIKTDSDPTDWAYIDFRVTIDGNSVTNGFVSLGDGLRWASIDSDFYADCDAETTDLHPGKMFTDSGLPLFHDVYLDPFGTDKWVWRFGIVCEITSSIKVEVRPYTSQMEDVECYIRGMYIP